MGWISDDSGPISEDPEEILRLEDYLLDTPTIPNEYKALELAEIFKHLKAAQMELSYINDTLVGRDTHPLYDDVETSPMRMFIATQVHQMISQTEGIGVTIEDYVTWVTGLPFTDVMAKLEEISNA